MGFPGLEAVGPLPAGNGPGKPPTLPDCEGFQDPQAGIARLNKVNFGLIPNVPQDFEKYGR
jgi:hypothetical protein